MRHSGAAALFAASLSSARAAVSQLCPSSDSSLCYALNVPDAAASSGSGDIFFQISAPSTYSWVALGQGNRMAGSNMFVIYTSGDGRNVTLSPRLGRGNVMPLHDTAADVTLLEGSGVSNGMMVANVRCSNCDSWMGGSMDFSSARASWLYAAKEGAALDSDDVEESIVQHDLYDPFTWDMTAARGGSDVNPFVTTATNDSTGTGTGTGTGTSAPQTTTTPSSQGSSMSSSSGVPSNLPMILMAHGIMAAVAFALLFPIGGIIIRVASFSGLPWVHAAIQMAAFLVYTAAFGLGIYIATKLDLISNHHPIIGIVVFGILAFQPALGLLHHRKFRMTGRRSIWSLAHLGIGRVAIILGIINGGLGLQLAGDAERHWLIAYGVVAGVFGLAYIAAAVFGETKKAKESKRPALGGGKGSPRDASMESAIPLEPRA